MARNSSELAHDRTEFLLSFVDSECGEEFICPSSYEEFQKELDEFDEGIELFHWLFDEARESNRFDEMSDLKRDIQRTKTSKRLYIEKFSGLFIADNTNRKEVATA